MFTHAYGNGERTGVRWLTSGLKVLHVSLAWVVWLGKDAAALPLYWHRLMTVSCDVNFERLTASLRLCLQVYYAPRRPVHAEATPPTLFGSFALLREVPLYFHHHFC